MALAFSCVAGTAQAQEGYVPAPENLAARAWFQDAKFGMFIHWGPSSSLMQGEWVMQNRRIRVTEYEWMVAQWNPPRFDAAAWVSLARAAGMRYITLITRHHDGFALFDSRVSDYTVVARTAYGRDIVRQLADECRRQDIRLFFYYSQLDWRHPDYYPRGQTGQYSARPDSGQWSRYLDFLDTQLAELLSNYGPVGGIWFDGEWDRPNADWRLPRTYALIHRLQPATLIIPNHHHQPRAGEDVQTFEQDLPGANTAGFNTTFVSDALPLETAATMNDSWGFNLTDRNYKSESDLIRLLARAAGANANLLLNVGPRPDGAMPPEADARLRAMGRWLERNGESIYGTRGGPVPPRAWGVTTQREDRVYVHVLDWADPLLALPVLPGRVTAARMLRDGSAVPFAETPGGLTLTLPPRDTAEVDRVVVLDVRR